MSLEILKGKKNQYNIEFYKAEALFSNTTKETNMHGLKRHDNIWQNKRKKKNKQKKHDNIVHSPVPHSLTD